MLRPRRLTPRVADVNGTIGIAEMFGPTLQGEGASQGRVARFVRLGHCNLDCKWCDTPYTWDWSGKNGVAYNPRNEIVKTPIVEVLEWCDTTTRIVITGGEPLVQHRQVAALSRALLDNGHIVEIETNGTFMPEDIDPEVYFTVSPKLGNSGVPWNRAIKGDVLREYANRGAEFKFVISEPQNVLEVEEVVRSANVPAYKVWLMPEGRSADEVVERLPWLFELCARKGYNLSTRLHVLAFGDKRGV